MVDKVSGQFNGNPGHEKAFYPFHFSYHTVNSDGRMR